MMIALRVLINCIGVLAISGLIANGSAHAHKFTVDDLLSIETIGAAEFDPTGRRVVWEQTPPYDEIGDYSINSQGAWLGNSGFQLKSIDLSEKDPLVHFLFDPSPKAHYWIDSFSPSGRYLAFYQFKDGAFTMGVYDFRQERLRHFLLSPVIHWYKTTHRSIWLSEDKFVFAALSDEDQPLPASRAFTARRMQQEWHKAWSGERSVAIATSGGPEDDRPDWMSGRLVIASARTGHVKTIAKGRYRSLAVSSDRQYLAALREAELPQPRGGEVNIDWTSAHSQLMLFDLRKGGPGRAVAAGKNVFPDTLVWAPNKNVLAFFAWDANAGIGVRSGVFNALDAETFSTAKYPHVGLDLASRRERGWAQMPERVMWVDGRLAVYARKSATPGAPHFTYRDYRSSDAAKITEKADWYLVDSTGANTNLTENFSKVSPIPIQADGSSLIILADGDVWRLAPGRPPLNLTSTVELPVSHATSVLSEPIDAPFTDNVMLIGRDDTRTVAILLSLSTNDPNEIAVLGGDTEILAASRSERAVLSRVDDSKGVKLSLTFANDSEILLDRLNKHLGEVVRSKWKTIKYKVNTNRGSAIIESCMLLPADYAAGHQYPVIVDVYPWPRGSKCLERSASEQYALGRRPWYFSVHLLAANGYIVFQPSFSRRLKVPSEGPLGGVTEMMMQGVDAMIAQGYVDPNRLGLFGFSQGGFLSLWMATQTNRFKAAVSINGWADMYSHYFESSYLTRFFNDRFPLKGSAARYEAVVGGDFGIGESPWVNPDVYVRYSPLFQAQKIVTPILLAHSDLDMFNLNQYERFFAALYLQHKKARFLRFWGEGHGPSSPGNIRLLWKEISTWYGQHLDVESRD